MYSLLNRCFLIDYGAWVAHPFRPEIYIKYQLGGYYIEVFVFFSYNKSMVTLLLADNILSNMLSWK